MSDIWEQCNRSKAENPTLGCKGRQLSWQTDCSISLDSLTNHEAGKSFPSHCSGRKILPLLSSSWQSVPSCLTLLCLCPSDSSLNNFRSSDLLLQVNLWTKNYSHHSLQNMKPSSVVLRCGLRLCRIEHLPYYHISPCTPAIAQKAELILSDLWCCFLYKGNDRVEIQTALGGSSCTTQLNTE